MLPREEEPAKVPSDLKITTTKETLRRNACEHVCGRGGGGYYWILDISEKVPRTKVKKVT